MRGERQGRRGKRRLSINLILKPKLYMTQDYAIGFIPPIVV